MQSFVKNSGFRQTHSMLPNETPARSPKEENVHKGQRSYTSEKCLDLVSECLVS